jgi:site-specific recombinase XerD
VKRLGINDAQINSLYVNDALDGLAKNTIGSYKVTLRQFLQFANSKKDLNKETTIVDIVNKAKMNITLKERKIEN